MKLVAYNFLKIFLPINIVTMQESKQFFDQFLIINREYLRILAKILPIKVINY